MKSEETDLFIHKQLLFYLVGVFLFHLRNTQRDFHKALGFPWTVAVSSKTTFCAIHFLKVDFLDRHSKVYLTRILINPDFLLSKTTALGITFQMKEMERIFLLLFPTESPSTFFSALLTVSVWLETHLYMPATKLSLSILPEPSKKQYRLLRCTIHNRFLLLSTRVQKPSPVPGCSAQHGGIQKLQGLMSADLSTQVGNHKPGVSYLAADPRLPSCLSLGQRLHVKMPLAAALV